MKSVLKFASLFLFVFALSTVDIFIAKAEASIMVSPVRVSFSDRERSTVVHVLNQSNQERTYRIEWMEMKMKPEGGYDPHEKQDGEVLASDIVRFSPRQITLAPGESQAIRLALRRPADLPAGEYRSHMVFKQIANTVPRGRASEERGAALRLAMNTSVSIPVVVRVGSVDAGAKFKSVQYREKMEKGKVVKGFEIEVERKGIHSPYGAINFYDVNDRDRRFPIATLNNVSIFPEIQNRKTFIPVLEKVETVPQNLIAVYEGLGEFRGQIFDETSVSTR